VLHTLDGIGLDRGKRYLRTGIEERLAGKKVVVLAPIFFEAAAERGVLHIPDALYEQRSQLEAMLK